MDNLQERFEEARSLLHKVMFTIDMPDKLHDTIERFLSDTNPDFTIIRYIPHSQIKEIYPAINEQIGIKLKDESIWFTSVQYTTDANGISGEFFQPKDKSNGGSNK